MVNLQELIEQDTGVLVAALAEVTANRLNALEQHAKAQMLFDRTYINRYMQSSANSHAAKDREAEFHAQAYKEDQTEFAKQIALHTTVADFITRLIDWRINGESSSRIQGRFGADTEARGSLEGSRERHPSFGSPQSVQGSEAS
jgi:hypothetical protein